MKKLIVVTEKHLNQALGRLSTALGGSGYSSTCVLAQAFHDANVTGYMALEDFHVRQPAKNAFGEYTFKAVKVSPAAIELRELYDTCALESLRSKLPLTFEVKLPE